jgi:hypothetical protein
LREDPELKDDAYMLSLLLESTTSTKTRTEDDSGRELWEDLPWWLALHQRLQYNYLTAVLAGPTAIVKDWSKNQFLMNRDILIYFPMTIAGASDFCALLNAKSASYVYFWTSRIGLNTAAELILRGHFLLYSIVYPTPNV